METHPLHPSFDELSDRARALAQQNDTGVYVIDAVRAVIGQAIATGRDYRVRVWHDFPGTDASLPIVDLVVEGGQVVTGTKDVGAGEQLASVSPLANRRDRRRAARQARR